jgi:ParB-like chromosome segregation protein Spo0J
MDCTKPNQRHKKKQNNMRKEIVSISRLSNNKGQIEGLPKNPRFIKDHKFVQLKQSIKEDPEMLELREVIAVDYNGELVVIAGNMRLNACLELGIKEVPCKILPQDTPIDKLKAITIKDNVGFGEHDWDALANDWDVEELAHWGLDLPIEAVDEDELESFEEEETFIIKLTCNSLEEQEKVYFELIEKGFNPNKI